MDANSKLINCEVYQPIVEGRVRVYGNDNVFYGNTVIADTLDNFGWYYELTVHGDLLNQGVIQDDSQTLYLKIDGSIINDGEWKNNYTYLNDVNVQHITCLNGNCFSGYQFESNNTHDVYFDAYNYFDNVRIDFHDNSIRMSANDTLRIHNAFLYRCKVYGDTSSVFWGEGDAGIDAMYVDHVELHNITMKGIVQVNGNDCSTYGLITNNAILMNTGWYNTLNIHGDIINNRLVQNSAFSFTINVEGDITNNGSWFNSNTSLTGTTDQTVTIQNGHIIQCHLSFVSDISTSPYQWVWNGSAIASSALFSGENSQSLHLNAATTANYNGIYYCNTGGGTSRNIIINDASNRAMILAFLEGAFNGANMNTILNASHLIPLTQPFDILPWNYSGNETVASMPDADIVDWVLLEFYDAVDAASAAAATPFARRACFLKKNAEIVDIDGGSLVSFSGTVSNHLFVKVVHRNHLDILSAYPANLNSYYYYYAFYGSIDQAYEGNQKMLNGQAVMIGGDVNADGVINASDKPFADGQAGKNGYYSSDLNLDGQVNNMDKNDIWYENTSNFAACSGNFIDARDGQSYSMVQIGNQCWMAENLNIGTMIDAGTDMTDNGILEKYCYNNTAANCDTYGGLYQWNESMQYSTVTGAQGICPDTWHLPTDEEWKTLEMFIGMSQGEADSYGWRGSDEGGKLKETGLSHWSSPNTGATDMYAFSGLPAGYRSLSADFLHSSLRAYFFTSDASGTEQALARDLDSGNAQIFRSASQYKNYGFSIRCIKN
jgi:uncharacterized protein (TIGR02145 family)